MEEKQMYGEWIGTFSHTLKPLSHWACISHPFLTISRVILHRNGRHSEIFDCKPFSIQHDHALVTLYYRISKRITMKFHE